MKIACYYPIHYGKEYLGYSIKSIYDSVDKIVIFYTQTPSYGHRTEMLCPDSESELQQAAFQFGDPQNKIHWMKGWYNNEGQHRDAAVNWIKQMGYDIAMTSDYDEVWDGESLKEAIEYVKNASAKVFRVPMIHFWKDFDHVCKDLAQPVRFTKFSGEGEDYVPMKKPVYHFGYAISDGLMAYKWAIHGHLGELRPGWLDWGWLDKKRIKDVHPTNENFWNVEKFDKKLLPDFLRQHPYWGRSI